MKRWYPKVYAAGSANEADLMVALNAADAYADLYEIARSDLIVDGRIESLSAKLPGIAEQRFAQLQDIEAILEYVETRERKATVDKSRHYMEHYQRTLSERTAKDYAEVSEEVQYIRDVRQRVASSRNLFLGIIKGIEYLHYQISNCVKLRAAGLEDAVIYKNS